MFALLQGPTQLACWTFSCPMRQFLNAFPLREGGGQRPGWMCLPEAQICTADSSFSFYGLLISRPTDSRIHPPPLARPSPRAYSISMLDVFLPYETVLKRVPPLEKGAAKGWDGCASSRHKSAQQIFLSLFYDFLISRPTDSRIHPAPLARPFSKGPLARDYLTWAFIPPTAYYLTSLLAKSS